MRFCVQGCVYVCLDVSEITEKLSIRTSLSLFVNEIFVIVSNWIEMQFIVESPKTSLYTEYMSHFCWHFESFFACRFHFSYSNNKNNITNIVYTCKQFCWLFFSFMLYFVIDVQCWALHLVVPLNGNCLSLLIDSFNESFPRVDNGQRMKTCWSSIKNIY